ncbi:MAG: hypothetical protein PHS49_01715 [Candidatus Gracilibacteria bacterium]|nr:hypothetical protein [Candidatus Gracilibacteria bacterium]
MNKKIIVIFIFILFLIIIFNYKNFFSTYYFIEANKNYEINNFSGALENYNKSYKYLSGYELEYNLGNTNFKLGLENENTDTKFEYFKKSIENYSKVIKNVDKENILYNDSVYNLDIVARNIVDLSQKIEEEKNEESKYNEEKQEKDEKHENNDESKEEIVDNNKKIDKSDDKSNNKSDEEVKLDEFLSQLFTSQEIQDLENYINNLSNEDEYNRQFYNNFSNIGNQKFDSNEKDW